MDLLQRRVALYGFAIDSQEYQDKEYTVALRHWDGLLSNLRPPFPGILEFFYPYNKISVSQLFNIFLIMLALVICLPNL